MNTQECYRILGVAAGAGWEEIRRRFRVLARQCHPDHHPGDPGAAAQFRRVVAAYEAIRAAKARSSRARQEYLRRPRVAVTEEELFEEFFGILNDDLPLAQSPGPDFRYDLRVPFAGAILGMETDIAVPRTLHCHSCGGSGQARGSSPRQCPDCQGGGRRYRGPGLLRFGPLCQRCGGQGKIVSQACPGCAGHGYLRQMRHYRVHIPPGTNNGTRLRLHGEGGEGFLNGPPGNLQVVISVEPDSFFTRVGDDLYCRVEVSFAQAALGGMIDVPTLEDHLTLNLPRGTQSGRIFRFPGAGVPGGLRQPRGDQVVEVVVATPEHLQPGQQEILAELARLEQEERPAAVGS
jgi:molecular chaperone DnaJ